ncbi:MAG: mechanosensitive ion channel [bacterium]|nr:mechanosensitive ion channel [bacterium]
MEGLYLKMMELGALYGTRIIGAIAIIILGRFAVGIFGSIIKRLLKKSKVDETLSKFLLAVAKIALLTFVVIAALNTLGIQTASFIAVIGAAGLAIGFALQGSLSNFASGVMLIIFRPLRTGDLVEAGGSMGIVQEIHIFNTILKTLDNKRVIIPNSKITSDNIVNYSIEGMLRIDMVFGISYGDDLRKAKQLLEKLVDSDERILKDPPSTVAVSELGDSSVNFVVRPYVLVQDYWGVYFDLTEKVKLTFDEQGISIPFPQRDVHISKNAVSLLN